MLGVAVKSTFVSERENVDEDIGQLGQGPTAVEVDLMQPLDAGPQTGGAHHALEPCRSVGRSPGSITWVNRLGQAVAWMTAQGARFAPGGIRKRAAGHGICFIHPSPATTLGCAAKAC